MSNELDYEHDMIIDESALDVEWLEQAQLAMRYIKNAVQARQQERLAAEKVKTVRSELINEANEDPEGCTGKSKPNAQDIEAYHRNDPRYKEAKEEWIKAAYEADFGELAQKEVSWSRRQALENLVTLHGQQYFAGPKVPRDLSGEVQKRKQANSRVKKPTHRRQRKE